jgi:hypothetical protein
MGKAAGHSRKGKKAWRRNIDDGEVRTRLLHVFKDGLTAASWQAFASAYVLK